MSSTPPFDCTQAHRWFSADCFNRAWALLEQPDRTREDDERMVSLAHASLAHWRQRADCQPRKLAVGYWQIARIYGVLGQADNARRYGQLCLEASGQEPPFYGAYAHEALARAARLNGDEAAFAAHLAAARRLADQVTDAGERRLLAEDLARLERP